MNSMASDLGFVAVVLIVVLIHFGVYSRVNRWFNPNKDSLHILTQKEKEDLIKYNFVYRGKGPEPSLEIKRTAYDYILSENVLEVSWAFLQLKSAPAFLERNAIQVLVIKDLEGTCERRTFLCFHCREDLEMVVEKFPGLVVHTKPFKVISQHRHAS